MDLVAAVSNLPARGIFVYGLLNYFMILSEGKLTLKGDQEVINFFIRMGECTSNNKDQFIANIRKYMNSLQSCRSGGTIKQSFGMDRKEFKSKHSTITHDMVELINNTLTPHVKSIPESFKAATEFMQYCGFEHKPNGALAVNSKQFCFKVKSLGSIVVKTMAAGELMDTVRTKLCFDNLASMKRVSDLLRVGLENCGLDYTGKLCEGDWNGLNVIFNLNNNFVIEVLFEWTEAGAIRPHGIYEKSRMKDNLKVLCTNLERIQGPHEAWMITIYIFKTLHKFFVLE